MFDKLKDFFRGKTNPRYDGNEQTITSDELTNIIAQVVERRQSSVVENVNSEFEIRYHRHKSSMPRLVPIGTGLLTKPDVKFDTMAYVIHCTKHNKVALYEDPTSAVKWFPFTPLFPDK